MISRGSRDDAELSFSVIIPTYNRPEHLAACLESLTTLRYPLSLVEVLVVDDGGDASLEAVVAPFRARLKVTLLRQTHAGQATARNTGVAHARGEFVAFIDDDCRPAPDWLRALARRLATARGAIVGGRMSNALPDNLYSTASQTLMDAVFAYYNTDPNRACNLISSNLAMSRRNFQAVGGFDSQLMISEDRDFCARCLDLGYLLVYAPDAVAYHVRPLVLGTFWRQHFGYGTGAYNFYQRRARGGPRRFKLDGHFFLYLLRFPFKHAAGWRALQLCGLLSIAQVATTAGLLREWHRHAAWRNALRRVKEGAL